MAQQLKEAFLNALSQMKSMGMSLPNRCDFQYVELSIMQQVTQNCTEAGRCLTVSEIHRTMHISKSGVSQSLSGLEEKGYIRREIDQNDRRRIAVTATEAGRQSLAQATSCYDAMLDDLFSAYGEENTRDLVEKISELCAVYNRLCAKE